MTYFKQPKQDQHPNVLFANASVSLIQDILNLREGSKDTTPREIMLRFAMLHGKYTANRRLLVNKDDRDELNDLYVSVSDAYHGWLNDHNHKLRELAKQAEQNQD